MFEAAGELWKEYLTLVSGTWPETDVRHGRGEVRDRLRRTDLILRHLHQAIDAVPPDPAAVRKRMEWILANLGRVSRGEMTPKEFDRGSMMPTQDAAALVDSWDIIWIFTETFYFSAWRMVEVLNNPEPCLFPGLGRVKAPAIIIVRNHLIQHPEKVKGGQDLYRYQGLVLTSSGPVLRSRSVVLRFESRRIDPSPDDKDQGLFAAAEELRVELERRFSTAISRAKA
jgi:hypothetical protein